MSKTICRWGFLGAANIARKNWNAIRHSGNGVITAVASRDVHRAEEFIRECSLETPPITFDEQHQAVPHHPVAVEGYQNLLDRDDIDAVYIALPTGVRKQWVLAAAEAGKHVLCEKPAAVHGDDLVDMIRACRTAGVGFIDGVMFDHSRRTPALVRAIQDGDTFGQLRRVQTHFSFNGDENFLAHDIRGDATLEPHGCLGDLGWYCIRLTLHAVGGRMPSAVSGETLWSLDRRSSDGVVRGVPGEFRGEMKFDDGVTAGMFCSFRCVNQQTALMTGSAGYITMDDFVLPLVGAESQFQLHRHDLRIDGGRWNFGRHTKTFSVAEYASDHSNAQEVNLVRTVAKWTDGSDPDPAPAKLALQTQRILDALRQSAASNAAWVTPILEPSV